VETTMTLPSIISICSPWRIKSYMSFTKAQTLNMPYSMPWILNPGHPEYKTSVITVPNMVTGHFNNWWESF
jgi:hypothetical protein